MNEDNFVQQLKTASEDEFSNYQDLPFGVIVVTRAGTLVRQTPQARIELENTIEEGENISKLFSNKSERDRIMYFLEKQEDAFWLKNKTIAYNINEKSKNINFWIRTIKKDNVFLGVLTLIFPSNPIQSFWQLEPSLPIGLFEISDTNAITFRNETFDNILGITSNTKSDKLQISDFIDKESRLEIYHRLLDYNKITNQRISLTKINGEKISAKINLIVEEFGIEENGRKILYKTKGFLEDVTYKDILEDFPTSLFTLELSHNNILVVKNFNQNFSKIFDLNMEDCRGRNFRDLVNNSIEYDDLYAHIINLHPDSNSENAYPIKIFTSIKSKDLSIFLKKHENHENYYTGLILDVTEEVDKKLTEWKQDFASLLHTYSAVNNNVVYTTQELISAHETEVVKDGKVSVEEVHKKITSLIKGFTSTYYKYSEINASAEFNEYDIRIRTHLKSINIDTDFSKNENYSVAFIRNNFVFIRSLLQKSYNIVQNIGLRNELRFHISEILRFLRLISLKYLNSECFNMTIDIDEFRNILRVENYTSNKKHINVIDVVRRAKNALVEYAIRRNLNISIFPEIFNEGKILANEVELYTVFYNILNNAIKYSWYSKNVKKVNVYLESFGNHILITFENFGTEITESEIANNTLFNFGLRGKSSQDRENKRSGTGIGLWHAYKITKHMKGDITIKCKPFFQNNFSEATKIFQTQFIVKIPKK